MKILAREYVRIVLINNRPTSVNYTTWSFHRLFIRVKWVRKWISDTNICLHTRWFLTIDIAPEKAILVNPWLCVHILLIRFVTQPKWWHHSRWQLPKCSMWWYRNVRSGTVWTRSQKTVSQPRPRSPFPPAHQLPSDPSNSLQTKECCNDIISMFSFEGTVVWNTSWRSFLSLTYLSRTK